MGQVTFYSKISSMGHDKYGDLKYAIYFQRAFMIRLRAYWTERYL